MKNFTNPLDNIKIASPCSADWNEMYGDHRKRFCGDCKLNVYNLSDMTKDEAENLLLNSEGRLCVRFYRRQDGTVLTQNCPVGWQAVKRRVSRVSAAAFSMMVGIFSGIFAFSQLKTVKSNEVVLGRLEVRMPVDKEVSNDVTEVPDGNYVMGGITAPPPKEITKTKKDRK